MSKKGNPVDIAKKADSKTLKRLLSYISQYRIQFIFVLVSILLSAVASVVSTLFLKTLIDDYITPLLLEAIPDFSGLARLILIMAGIYLIGVIATLFYNRVMVVIAQGVLKEIRDEMFEKMQKLPIRYFDTHSHGDIMSHYTNDTDTLRQMLTQSIPQLFSSVVTIVAVFVSMLTLSLWLTIFVVLFTFIILKVVGNIASKSSKYFVSQQKSLGNVNGYIEEMINGQKVVKVFCHEDKAKELFNQKNEELCKNATEANRFANMLGPLMNNMGYILYVSMAIVGGGLAILGVTNVSLSGVGTLTLGMIASFLQLSRSFIMPLSQVSQQLSSIVMAIAGAGRIFNLIDEKHEEDRGYVTLVNVNKINGEIIETKEHSHHWAWKHPHSDGTITYTELKGEVRFFDVDFGYNEEKIVLHNISLYAEPGQKIAFVGATGAGKTTITNLINRFYDIADGKIRYDGININKIKKNDLRRSLGIVLQDVNLFTGTVMEIFVMVDLTLLMRNVYKLLN